MASEQIQRIAMSKAFRHLKKPNLLQSTASRGVSLLKIVAARLSIWECRSHLQNDADRINHHRQKHRTYEHKPRVEPLSIASGLAVSEAVGATRGGGGVIKFVWMQIVRNRLKAERAALMNDSSVDW
jgi:hypothetical protein